MHFLAWIIVGLIAGAFAKAIVPGKEPGGFLATLAIGGVGGIVGGFVSRLVLGSRYTGLNLMSVLFATVGAVILLFIWKAVAGKMAV